MPINKELIQRARKSNAAYKEDLRKAEEEEKARLATREREKEEAARKKAAEANTEVGEEGTSSAGENQGQEGIYRGAEQHSEDSSAYAKGE